MYNVFCLFYLAGELCHNVLMYQDKIFTGVGLCKGVLKWIQLVTKTQGEGAILGVFFPTDNALYSWAFGTHTKTAVPIEMPFGMMTRVGPRYYFSDGRLEPPRGRGNFWGKRSGPLWSNETLYGELCKNVLTDQHVVLDEDSGGSKEPCVRSGVDAPRPKGKGAIVGGCLRHSKALAIFTAVLLRRLPQTLFASIANNVMQQKGLFSMLGKCK